MKIRLQITAFLTYLVGLLVFSAFPLAATEDGLPAPPIASSPKPYLLGPGDIVEITIDHIPKISSTYAVTAPGIIEFPTLLQPLRAAGLTVNQLEEVLMERLKRYIHQPSVAVRIREHHSHKILLLGPFATPGKYELEQEEVPLLDVVLEAGGLRELRENDKLIILRRGKAEPIERLANGDAFPRAENENLRSITIDINALLSDGDITQNVMVQSGDVIYISSFFEPGRRYIYVTGGRKGAAAIPYEAELTALKALFQAGVVPDDLNTAQVQILREQAGVQQVLTVGLTRNSPDNATNILQPGDIIILPDADRSMVYVMGRVNQPQAVLYQENLTILQAILKAGGFTQDAVSSKVRIVREGALSPENQLTVNVDAVLDGDKTQNVTLEAGDIIVVPGRSLQADISVTGAVHNPGLIAYEDGLTLREVIIRAGSFSGGLLAAQIQIVSEAEDKKTTVHFDLANPSADTAGLRLHPGDLIIVSSTTADEAISVLGSVASPGIIQFEEGLTILRAILHAGGFAQGAARSKVKIVRGEGPKQQTLRANLEALMDKGDKSQDIALRPGDIIIVPQSFF